MAEQTPKPSSDKECIRCRTSRAKSKPADGICCSSHNAAMCHRCYRLTHFVEVCGCPRCDAEGLPRIFPNREVSSV